MLIMNYIFVSPELSSGRDYVIQMSVRRPPSVFLSGAFLGNRMPYLDDIWYVGGASAEGAHAESGRGTCWSPGTAGVKNVKQCSMTTKLGQKSR